MKLTIEKLVYGGEGLAHSDGQTIFVPFVLPGEVVEAQVIDRKKKFVRARLLEVLTPSPDRASPPCPHFTDCGGCDYQHMAYETQLRAKAEILRETLRRIGKASWEGPIKTHPSPPLGYRNRAQWKVRPEAGRSGALSIGYFRSGTSALCAVTECPILSPRLAATLAALREWLAGGTLPPTLTELEAFADEAEPRILLNASFAGLSSSPEAIAATFHAAIPELATLLLHDTSRDRMELDGPGYISYRVGAAEYRVGHLSFFQTNRFLIEEMVAAVEGETPGGLALDLFAGVGLFTLPLARRFERVVAVESNPAAARDLKANLEAGGTSAQVMNSEVEKFLAAWKDRPDLVLLDPPRGGVPAAALARIAQLAPPRISYFSCDPATLARDLATLLAAEYRITELQCFDVFPETFHIESLVRLERNA